MSSQITFILRRFFGAPNKLKGHLQSYLCAKFGAFVHSVTILTKFRTNSLDYVYYC